MNGERAAGDLADTEATILHFLRSFEAAQQDIVFSDIAGTQQRLASLVGDGLEEAAARLPTLQIEPGLAADLKGALDHLLTARNGFMRALPWPDFGAAFIASRFHYCRALEILYRQRHALGVVEGYYRLPGSELPAEDTHEPGSGVTHQPATDDHNEYSLYVPEYDTGGRALPLVVSLHGGYGRGDDYLWTWLRIARSRGMVILSPKSHGPTWSIRQPRIDMASILAMLDEVAGRHRIDDKRTLLTGLSDGATFSLHLGLEHAECFSALAPIAGVLSPTVDPLLRQAAGKHLPIHLVHGVHDAIFPVESARSTAGLLRHLDYAATYTELPDWGHALTGHINATLIMPWFDSLVG